MNTENQFDNIEFILPKNQSNVIKVIGIGGGGINAINYMYNKGIKGVDYVVCNTDSQALENSPVPNKVQLGIKETEGLGAGADPVIGEKAAIESLNEMRRLLEKNTKMIFITAGMGGGTGTGAAPIISKLAMEMDILTVGIVTMPFVFEGKIRMSHANKGLEKLRSNVDSLIVVNNNKLRDIYGNLGVKEGFSKADEVLATAAKGIAEVITHHYTQNIDLKDAKTVLSKSGNAIMGSYSASGEKRSVFTTVFSDFNNDFWPDIYLIHEFGNGVLLLNDQKGKFEKIMIAEFASDFGSMGLASGDFNNDKNIDIYVSSMYSSAGTRVISNLKENSFDKKVMSELKSMVRGSQLYSNLGKLKFEKMADKYNLASVGWGYGPIMSDLNNDSWLDIYTTSGFVSRNRDKPDG